MKGIVDRIEKDVVVIEIEKEIFNFNIDLFPENIKEGDLVEYEEDKFIILEDETKKREKEIRDLFHSLIEKDD
ncbi:DUF3006 domain-containing protein [Tissierella sp. MSJ-40]|uniref:DUF3006 domain-containing protein n=1 Tax=Tissierella simiarum TaxID=2841534 RepID=A0ABS6EA88_9FIRM|nr:DUF3006 domain-containing protein [Tissierella simiarum]MBU5439669.1 DUF3006 domain-containing protein [Tissierella simiarum]